MELKPRNDYVVIKPMTEKETIKGGIIIPDSAKEKPVEGEVVAVGPGVPTITSQGEQRRTVINLEVGDKVIYNKYGSTEVTINGEEYLMMKESNILAVITS